MGGVECGPKSVGRFFDPFKEFRVPLFTPPHRAVSPLSEVYSGGLAVHDGGGDMSEYSVDRVMIAPRVSGETAQFWILR